MPPKNSNYGQGPELMVQDLPDPEDSFMARAAPGIMEAMAMFGESSVAAMQFLLIHIARLLVISGTYDFLNAGNTSEGVVISRIGACLQARCKSYEHAEEIFKQAITLAQANILNGTLPPAKTPSPAPREPTQETESLDELIDRRIRHANRRLPQDTSHQHPRSSSSGAPPEDMWSYFVPTRASHGLGHVRDLPRVPEVLENERFDIYRWTTKDPAVDSLMREALALMITLIEDRDRFRKWCEPKGVTLTSIEFSLFSTGSFQAVVELCTAVMLNNRPLVGLLIAARTLGADVNRLQDHADGSFKIACAPLFGGNKAGTKANSSGGGGNSGGGGGDKDKKQRDAKAKAEKADKALKAATEAAAKAAKELKEVSN